MIGLVVDTNVLVSALIAPEGAANEIVARAHAGAIRIIACPHLIAELDATLRKPRVAKLIGDPAVATDYVRSIVDVCEMREDPTPGAAWTRDPTDDFLVDLALEGGVAIVTFDRDLIDAAAPVIVLTPSQVLDAIA